MAEKKIGNRTFITVPIPAGEAIVLYAEIISALGAAVHRLPAIILSAQADGDEQSLMADIAALAAVTDVVKSVTPEGASSLIQKIISLAEIKRPGSADYHSIEFDSDFQGEYLKDIIPVAKFILTEQYSDFFTGSGVNGLLAHLKAGLQNRKS